MRIKEPITKKGQLFLLLFVIFLSVSLAYAAEPRAGYKYVGSVNSNKYHYFSCRWAKKIYQTNAIYFESVKKAQESGYIPCKVCRPPIRD